MLMALSTICVTAMGLLLLFWMKRRREDREFERHTITPEALHALLDSDQELPILDVRQPLDLLAHSEIIPGAKRLSPEEVIKNPSLIPKEKESIVYCTCPDDKTARAIVRRALAMSFSKVKLLKGGLEAWKAKGYPVEPYRDVFRLYTPRFTKYS